MTPYLATAERSNLRPCLFQWHFSSISFRVIQIARSAFATAFPRVIYSYTSVYVIAIAANTFSEREKYTGKMYGSISEANSKKFTKPKGKPHTYIRLTYIYDPESMIHFTRRKTSYNNGHSHANIGPLLLYLPTKQMISLLQHIHCMNQHSLPCWSIHLH